MSDAEILDWLEANHTLHNAVEIVYVVDGYDATLTYDGSPVTEAFGSTLREAVINLRAECAR